MDTLLELGCTIVVPTFCSSFSIPPPPDLRPPRNGLDYSYFVDRPIETSREVFTPESNDIDADMGVLPAAVLARPDRVRGNHPLNSFTAIGRAADELIRKQSPLDVYAPLEALADAGGVVLLIGVGLNRMTLIHLAERHAGRTLFRRWAKGRDGSPMMCEAGGCSTGFPRLEDTLGPLARERLIGRSRWRAFPAATTMEAAAQKIRHTPSITRCDRPRCDRCRDAIAGGPLL